MDENLLNDFVDRMRLEKQAQVRYISELPKARLLARRYEDWHEMYAPVRGDQWPEDRRERPGKLHITSNIIQAFVDTEARILSIIPTISNQPDSEDEELRMRAEATEKLMLRYLEMSGWEVWMFTWHQVRGIYGKAFLKPFWNTETNAPDVEVIEQPQNVIVGWGDSNFSVVDWIIYRQTISPTQAHIRYPNAPENAFKASEELMFNQPSGTDHSDPLEQLSPAKRQNVLRGTGYEASQIELWDYWYLDETGKVMNATLLNGVIVDGPTPHPEYPAIPYIPSEWSHEPGYPDGHGMVEILFDIQMGLNRALSHFAQYVWDNTDPAYQLVGENAPMTVPENVVPIAGEIVAPGPGSRIESITQGVNQFPLADLIRVYWDTAFKITGLPEVLFGGLPGSQTSGRAVAVQIEAAANRIDPRRRRSYDALRQLLTFWNFMIQKIKPKTADGFAIADVTAGLDRWKIIAPEITPRDVVEHTMNIINQLNAKLISLETAMDQIGVESPLKEMRRIMAERSNVSLFPADAQAKAAVMATMLSLQGQAAQMGISFGQDQGQGAQQFAQAQQQAAQPTGFEDMNQPMPQAGGPPPPGAPAPGGVGELQPLVRQTAGGESQSLSQIVVNPRQV